MFLIIGYLNLIAQEATEDSGGMFDFSTILMTGGILLLIVILLMNMRKRYRSQGPSGGAAERLDRMEMGHGMKKDLNAMMVELEDLSRQMSSQLDSKSMRLEKQMEEAEQMIAELRQMLQQGQTLPTETVHTSHGMNTASPPSSTGYSGHPDVTAELSQEPVFKPSAQPTYIEPGYEDPKQQRIIELAQQGKNAVQIARELDEQIGKVELILALRKN